MGSLGQGRRKQSRSRRFPRFTSFAIIVLILSALVVLQWLIILPLMDTTSDNTVDFNIEPSVNSLTPLQNAKIGEFGYIFSSKDGLIYGNPMEFEQCSSALLHQNNFNQSTLNTIIESIPFDSRKHLNDQIWFRESIAALLESSHELYIPTRMHGVSYNNHIFDWTKGDTINRSELAMLNNFRSVYYHIPKSASSTMHEMLNTIRSTYPQSLPFQPFGKEWKTALGGTPLAINSTCGFTFIRDPLWRLISGYYTINVHLWAGNVYSDENPKKSRYEKWSFIHTYGEPYRFRHFIENLLSNPNLLVTIPPFQHVATQTAYLASFYGSQISVLGRVESLDDHWSIITGLDGCVDDLHSYGSTHPSAKVMKSVGVSTMSAHSRKTKRALNPKYSQMLSLQHYDASIQSKSELPAVKAIDQSLFNKIVEYYWQDYVCFGYEPRYPQINLSYTGQYMFPS